MSCCMKPRLAAALCVCVCVYIYIYIHTHTHTHIYSYTCILYVCTIATIGVFHFISLLKMYIFKYVY